MKNLSFSIDKNLNEVTFTFGKHSSITRLVQENQLTISLNEYYSNIVKRCVTVEEVNYIVNSGNQRFERVELVFKDLKGLPMVCILKNQTPLTKNDMDKIEEEYNEVQDYNKKVDAYNKQLISATNEHQFNNAANFLP